MGTHAKRSAAVISATSLAAIGLCAPATAIAGTQTATLSVSATVSANCTVSTTAVSFGSVNTIGGSNVDGTGTVSVTCTNGSPWTASADAGTGSGATLSVRRMTSGANTLNYVLYTNSGHNTVWGDGTGTTATVTNTGTGSAQSFTVYGRVPSGQTAVPAGSYSDTVAVTVTY